MKYLINQNNKHLVNNYYNYFPTTREELQELVNKLIKERGLSADLNDIDTSEITSMNFIFYKSRFNGDISQWDVSNVTGMTSMFERSYFNGDISQWDVRKVEFMENMFRKSKFNGNLNNWNPENIIDDKNIFDNCPIQQLWKYPDWWYKNKK